MSMLLVPSAFGLQPNLIAVIAVLVAVCVVGQFVLMVRGYRKAASGTALVRNGMGGIKVSFTGLFVLPLLHEGDTVDISTQRVDVKREAPDGVVFKDAVEANIRVSLYVRVGGTEEDVIEAYRAFGAAFTRDGAQVADLFRPKLLAALQAACRELTFLEAYEDVTAIKDGVLRRMAAERHGYVLDDLAIDDLRKPKDAGPPRKVIGPALGGAEA